MGRHYGGVNGNGPDHPLIADRGFTGPVRPPRHFPEHGNPVPPSNGAQGAANDPRTPGSPGAALAAGHPGRLGGGPVPLRGWSGAGRSRSALPRLGPAEAPDPTGGSVQHSNLVAGQCLSSCHGLIWPSASSALAQRFTTSTGGELTGRDAQNIYCAGIYPRISSTRDRRGLVRAG